MFWFILILILIGVIFYIADKKIKSKFEDKFDPKDWDLPGSTKVPDEIKPHVSVPSVGSDIGSKNVNEKIVYEKNLHVIPSTKTEFYKALYLALGNNYTLLTNINLASILTVVAHDNSLIAQVAEKNMATKQVDFLICDNENLRAVCVVILDGALEPFLVNACESAGLPIAQFKMQHNYSPLEIRDNIFQVLGVNSIGYKENITNFSVSESPLDIMDVKSLNEKKEGKYEEKNEETILLINADTEKEKNRGNEKNVEENSQKENVKEEVQAAKVAKKEASVKNETFVSRNVGAEKEVIRTEGGVDLKLCPQCSAVMLKRKAKSGINAGQVFWICSTYPHCRGMLVVQ